MEILQAEMLHLNTLWNALACIIRHFYMLNGLRASVWTKWLGLWSLALDSWTRKLDLFEVPHTSNFHFTVLPCKTVFSSGGVILECSTLNLFMLMTICATMFACVNCIMRPCCLKQNSLVHNRLAFCVIYTLNASLKAKWRISVVLQSLLCLIKKHSKFMVSCVILLLQGLTHHSLFINTNIPLTYAKAIIRWKGWFK